MSLTGRINKGVVTQDDAILDGGNDNLGYLTKGNGHLVIFLEQYNIYNRRFICFVSHLFWERSFPMTGIHAISSYAVLCISLAMPVFWLF
jgi:hypothetical protein